MLQAVGITHADHGVAFLFQHVVEQYAGRRRHAQMGLPVIDGPMMMGMRVIGAQTGAARGGEVDLERGVELVVIHVGPGAQTRAAHAQIARMGVVLEAGLEGQGFANGPGHGHAGADGAIGRQTPVTGVRGQRHPGQIELTPGVGGRRGVEEEIWLIEIGRLLRVVAKSRGNRPFLDRLDPVEVEGMGGDAPSVDIEPVAAMERGIQCVDVLHQTDVPGALVTLLRPPFDDWRHGGRPQGRHTGTGVYDWRTAGIDKHHIDGFVGIAEIARTADKTDSGIEE